VKRLGDKIQSLFFILFPLLNCCGLYVGYPIECVIILPFFLHRFLFI
jgi:hypothetical protein